jgi:SAM-dependent methyltransferase
MTSIIFLLSVIWICEALLVDRHQALKMQIDLQSSISKLSKVKEKLRTIFNGDNLQGNIYVCPESLQPLELATRYYGLLRESYFVDRKFGAKYKVSSVFVDFNPKLGTSNSNFKIGQSFFQIPLVSGLYERGYRQNFENFGFPGIDKEFQEALEFFTSANLSSIILDLSCGSGFMTRKFSKSGRFDRVIAADLSPTMLAETKRRCLNDQVKPLPEIIRCDSAKLPFRTNAVDAVHAGAAMHCWPAINQSLSEVYRVLKPGGRFFATTFINPTAGLMASQARSQGFTMFVSDEEIQALVREAGFTGDSGSCEVRREGSQCVVVKAIKAVNFCNELL